MRELSGGGKEGRVTTQRVRDTGPSDALEAYERDMVITRVEDGRSADATEATTPKEPSIASPSGSTHRSVLDEWKIKSAARPLPWQEAPDSD